MSPEAREGTRGETPWPGGDLNTRWGGVGNREQRGGRETQVMGRQPDAEGAAKQMRKRLDRRHKRGWLCSLPPTPRRAENGPLLLPSRGPTTPLPPLYFPCTLEARRALLPLCRPRRGRGPKQVRPSRGRPRARGAPPPPVWLPPASPRGALFVPARGPGPRGRPGARGRAGGGGALPTCLCEAAPGVPWVL